MKMLIVEGDEVLFSLDNVDKPPLGIFKVPPSGFALSSELKMVLTRFFHDGTSPEPVKPECSKNVVKFPQRDFRFPDEKNRDKCV